MIASSIGKIFLKEYNKREGKDCTSKEFFEQVFHPLFFDHEKYMQWITNSPFVQGIRKGQPPTAEERIEKLVKLKEKMAEPMADASIAIGYPSLDEMSTTSGQLTNLDLPLENEDFYASWIGGGLGVGVKGGFSIYFDQPDILWKIYEGWQKYRELLEQYEHLRGNQIESWNGQWLAHIYSEGFVPGQPFFPPENVQSGKYKGMMEIPTKRWTDILIAIARTKEEQAILNGYVFSLGQMNTTVGFIPFHLPQIRKPVQFYIDLFGEREFLDNANLIISLYGTAMGFLAACQMGVIGIRAMEPKDLKKYMGDSRNKPKAPNYTKADEIQEISFKSYQIWLLAMLDNKQLWERAGKAAQAYLDYEKEYRQIKKVSPKGERQVESVLDSPSKRKFIEANIPILETSNNTQKAINELVEEVNSMPEDSFRYFSTLIKFRYKYFQSEELKTEAS